MKNRSLFPICAMLTVAFVAADLMAHGFVPPPLPVSSAPAASSSSSSSSSSGSSGAPAPGQSAPNGGSTGGSSGGGATGGGAAGGNGGRGGGRPARPPRGDDKGGSVGADSGSSSASGNATLGSAFKAQLKSDLALLKDRTVLLDVSCLDAALRRVEFRVRINELRTSAADVRKRVDVETKTGDAWQVRETYILAENGSVVTAHAWTRDGGVRKLNSNPLDVVLAGTSVALRDVLPFDATTFATFTFNKTSEVNFLAHETYTLKQPDGNGAEAVVTFRSDLRVPTHAELLRSGLRHRAFDYTGWRYAAGGVVPSRVSILGASLEPIATVDVREANINTNVNPSLFDASKLAGGEVVSAPR